MGFKRLICAFLGMMMLMFSVPCFAAAEGSAEVPELDTLYPAQKVRLRLLGDENKRVFGYYGPGKDYYSANGYKPYKQGRILAYFNEGGWVLVDMQYQSGKERYMYLADSAFEPVKDIPSILEMQYFEGETINATEPRLGPSVDFILADGIKSIPSGTALKVFFRKDGYYYSEFQAGETPARLWIPVSDIRILGTGTYVPDERERIRIQDLLSSLAVGEWSEWTDAYIATDDSFEVQQREVYRTKNEIMDWTDWIDGDASEDEWTQTRMVTNPDGTTKMQWREYGYHYHYGEWSEWSEDPLVNVASSWDIHESKTQWRYKRIK